MQVYLNKGASSVPDHCIGAALKSRNFGYRRWQTYIRGGGILLLCFSILAGCREPVGIAQKQRNNLSPRVARYMVEAEGAFSRGVYEVALAYTDSAEVLMPELADLHYLRGKIYTQLNRLDIAQAAYDVVLEIDPEYAGTRFNMGLNSFRRGKLRDAINYYLEEESAVGPTPALFHELGRAYARLGVPDSAQEAYEQVLELDPENTTTYMWLGQLLEETGDLEGALEMSLHGLRLRPDDLDYQYIVGTQYLRLDSAEAALAYLEPVAQKWTWHHGAQFNLGQVYMRLGREVEADVYFSRAEEAQQLQQRVTEAQNAIDNDPNSPANWIELANRLRESKRYDRAIEAIKNGLTIRVPPGLELYMQTNLATLYMECGNPDEAAGRFEAILRADPDLSAARLNLGIAYAQVGRIEEARSAWRELLEREPGNLPAQNYLEQLDTMDQNDDYAETDAADCLDST